jgi:hypothetical protein
MAVAVVAVVALLYVLGFHLGPDKKWRTPSGQMAEEGN